MDDFVVEAIRCGTLKDEYGDPRTREGFDNVINLVKKHCRLEFEENGVLEPCFYITYTDAGGEHQMLVFPVGKYFVNEKGKNLAPVLVRMLAERVNAYSTIFAAEAWMAHTNISKDDPRTAEELRATMPDSLADLPEDQRFEVINLIIEHNDFGQSIESAVIDRSSGKPILGEFSLPPGAEDVKEDADLALKGRMTGFIGATRKDRN